MLEQNTLQLPAKFEHRANRFAVHLLSFGNQIEPGETITEFCLKHGIPINMHRYLEYFFPVQNKAFF